MKKILVLFLMFFGIGQVSALEYSDYSDFGEYTENYIQKDELTDVKTERRYKYYKLEKELGGYGENNSIEYPFIDKDDYIHTDYSGLNTQRPEEKEGRIIEEVNGYHYKKIKDINYLKISASMGKMTLGEFEILYKGEKIDYDIDTNRVNENMEIAQNGYIKFKFKDNLELRYLTFSFKLLQKDGSTLVYVYSGNEDREYTFDYLNKVVGPNSYYYEGLKASYYNSAEFDEFYSEEKLETGTTCQLINSVTLYKYKDILYRNYKLNRIYYSDYLTGPYEEYIYKDDSVYKDYYSKRTRTIKEDLKIEEPNLENNEIKTMKRNEPIIKDNTELNYTVPKKAVYYPLNINKVSDIDNIETKGLLIKYFPFILLLVTLILLLSKLYKRKE